MDLGDGVLGLEFHSKMNTLGEDIFSMIYAGLEETARNWQAMVIANQGADFSAGANLMMVVLAAQEGEWDELNLGIHRFQQANMAIKCSPKPVVVGAVWHARWAAAARWRCMRRACRLRPNCTWVWWKWAWA